MLAYRYCSTMRVWVGLRVDLMQRVCVGLRVDLMQRVCVGLRVDLMHRSRFRCSREVSTAAPFSEGRPSGPRVSAVYSFTRRRWFIHPSVICRRGWDLQNGFKVCGRSWPLCSSDQPWHSFVVGLLGVKG